MNLNNSATLAAAGESRRARAERYRGKNADEIYDEMRFSHGRTPSTRLDEIIRDGAEWFLYDSAALSREFFFAVRSSRRQRRRRR